MASFLKGAFIGLTGLAAALVVVGIAVPPAPLPEAEPGPAAARQTEGRIETGSLALMADRDLPDETAILARLQQRWGGQIGGMRDGLSAPMQDQAGLPEATTDLGAGQSTGGAAVQTAAAAADEPTDETTDETTGAPVTRRLPQIGFAPGVAPEAVPAVTPDVAGPAALTPPQAAPGADSRVAAVRTDRLPQIGVAPQTVSEVAPLPRWQRNRAAVTLQDMPRLGLILFDPTDSAEAEAAILAMPVPVTVALPPFAEDAPRRARAYAAAGHEVLLSLETIPALAQASDLEVLFTAWIEDFPDALGVIDPPSGDARRGRSLAPALIPLLDDLDLALVAPERGLSPLLGSARQGGVAHLGIYRSLDAAEGDVAALGRILDRVAFEARRQDRLAVLARADDAATRAALADWLVAGGSGGAGAQVQALPAGALLAAP